MAYESKSGLCLRIVSDGTPMGTRIVEEDSGLALGAVQSITWHLDVSTMLATCDVQLLKVPVDLRGKLADGAEMVHAENLIVPCESDPIEGDESTFWVRDFDEDPIRIDVERHDKSSEVLLEMTIDDECGQFYLYRRCLDSGQRDVQAQDRVPVEALIPVLEACGYSVRRKAIHPIDDAALLASFEELTGVKVRKVTR
jgi:hypothetical protein